MDDALLVQAFQESGVSAVLSILGAETHLILVATLGEKGAPELSPAFQVGLERKLASVVEVRPLEGWRKATMVAYGAASIGMVGWALRNVPLPTIDLSAPWVAVAAFIAVPLTFLLAIAASRWLPSLRPPRGLHGFAL
jgi:hypothetical protein